jgi:hypothetical protein
MDKLCVIQADRDAAADFLSLLASDDIREWEAIGNLRTGEHDDNPAVKSFAAHRIASQAELVALLESMPVDVEFANSELFRAAVNDWWDTDVAPALAALSHTKGEGE